MNEGELIVVLTLDSTKLTHDISLQNVPEEAGRNCIAIKLRPS